MKVAVALAQAVKPAVLGVCIVSLTQNTGRQRLLLSDHRQPLVLGSSATPLEPQVP